MDSWTVYEFDRIHLYSHLLKSVKCFLTCFLYESLVPKTGSVSYLILNEFLHVNKWMDEWDC